MPLFLVTSVCDDGVDAQSFRVIEAGSPLAIAQNMLEDPWAWEPLLRDTALWWELSRYEQKYDLPLEWTAADLLERIAATQVDGGSRNQVRIHAVGEVLRLGQEIGTAFQSRGDLSVRQAG